MTTYEQRRAELAEKMMVNFHEHVEGMPSLDELSFDELEVNLNYFIPLAELALADMADSVKNVMIYVYTSDAIERHLITNGLVPQKPE